MLQRFGKSHLEKMTAYGPMCESEEKNLDRFNLRIDRPIKRKFRTHHMWYLVFILLLIVFIFISPCVINSQFLYG